ncbi:cytochrome c oxidase subunit 3 [Dyadobacter jejuensis]|uniref:Cytochrome c oxidase subunit 3 n=1 Tax=Dyadobacter jejuensis TaxID=1082580 RepID=A0A316AQL6_9BACT|nr:cytochrome c oxidase subunit 3 [Dyadobacter jejuensis]PWJ60035.1 cytochrome c oxidase subunit 3 [Dyadobacter jejuensis]
MSTKHSTRFDENKFTKRREPLGFMLWLGLGGSILLFAVIFFSYWTRVNPDSYNYIVLPDLFWLSTLVILFSSITLHEANLAFKQERFLHFRIFLGATLALGLIFMVLQASGWYVMSENWVFVKDNMAIGFVYLLTGLHMLHILVGVVYMGMLFQKALKNSSYVDSFVYSVNPPNRLKVKLVTRYWHFVDALWLVVFLLLVVIYH